MKELTKERLELAVKRIQQISEHRKLSQKQMEEWSGIGQSTISKIFNRSQDPSPDTLKKLCRAIGVRLGDLISDDEVLGRELVGYLATPLTGLTDIEDTELRSMVNRIKTIAATKEFDDPHFELYWPGDHTHPKTNPEITSSQVYLTDRSRASSYDFIIILGAASSFGVGQENEIATQAGLSAIRLLPPTISRMMRGSFIDGQDIEYNGTLATGIHFSEQAFLEALRNIRVTHFRRQALYRNLNGNDFGERLRKLINERGGDYTSIAKDVGINLSYLHVLLQEPFSVSNPSARILKRFAARLGEGVGYLLGEADKSDPLWVSSQASFRQWVEANPHVPAFEAFALRDEWRDQYRLSKNQPVSVSHRKPTEPMSVGDWDRLYKRKKPKGAGSEKQTQMFS